MARNGDSKSARPLRHGICRPVDLLIPAQQTRGAPGLPLDTGQQGTGGQFRYRHPFGAAAGLERG
ncbi:hypothetical protein D3C78_1621620 [compost metagenome]